MAQMGHTNPNLALAICAGRWTDAMARGPAHRGRRARSVSTIRAETDPSRRVDVTLLVMPAGGRKQFVKSAGSRCLPTCTHVVGDQWRPRHSLR